MTAPMRAFRWGEAQRVSVHLSMHMSMRMSMHVVHAHVHALVRTLVHRPGGEQARPAEHRLCGRALRGARLSAGLRTGHNYYAITNMP